MIRKRILTILILLTFNSSFSQDKEVYLSYSLLSMNPDSLRADSIKRVNAFPEYFRSYYFELNEQELNVDTVIGIKKHYQKPFLREFREPRDWGFILHGPIISTNTLVPINDIYVKMDRLFQPENYFGFIDNQLRFYEQVSWNQCGADTWRTHVSADRKAMLFHSTQCVSPREELVSFYYYYFDGNLIVVSDNYRFYTTEVELSAFSNMNFVPKEVQMMLELEDYIKN